MLLVFVFCECDADTDKFTEGDEGKVLEYDTDDIIVLFRKLEVLTWLYDSW